jgi:uncharacterized protein with GYD domain
MIRFSYTPETWARLVKNPEDRREAVGKMASEAGGTVHGFWYAFGDRDGYVLFEGPDNASAAAVSIATAASGALRAVETTVLISPEEMVQALGNAASLGYRPPGA